MLREVAIPDPEPVAAAWATYPGVETAIAHESTYPARAGEYSPPDRPGVVAGLIELGRATSAVQLMRAHHARLAFSGALATLLTEVDLLLIPTQPIVNFTVERKDELYTAPDELAALLRFATPFDMSGSPTITLPGGIHAGLPLTFQLVGRHLDEALLARAGDAYQRATDWHTRHPAH